MKLKFKTNNKCEALIYRGFFFKERTNMKNFEGFTLLFGLLILFLVALGYLNNWEFVRDIWDILQSLSQALSELISSKI
jgi:hypothetical protein